MRINYLYAIKKMISENYLHIYLLDMKKITLIVLTFLSLIVLNLEISAQCNQSTKTDLSGRPCGGTIQTAVPFLRINPDARSGGMGDVGIAISPDANSIHFNASKLALSEQNFGASLTYTPWLRNLGLDDIYLAYGSGFYQFGTNVKQAVGVSLRYFALGAIDWTDNSGNAIGTGSPREFEFAGAYSRQLSKYFAIGVTGKYIYSNLASGQSPGGSTARITSAHAGAGDISATYRRPIKMSGGKSLLTIGSAITGIGNKVTYLNGVDFLPTNLGIGGAWDIPIDQFNSIVVALDVNKLLTPTSDTTLSSEWRKKSVVSGMLGSFSDAPGGGSEELQELGFSAGVEYWYDRAFAVRAGYFYEHPSKGGRKFFTVGLGLKYSVLSLNLSYLVPGSSSARDPLANTLRFSLLFNAASFKDDEESSSGN
jgi:hypothetical protein